MRMIRAKRNLNKRGQQIKDWQLYFSPYINTVMIITLEQYVEQCVAFDVRNFNMKSLKGSHLLSFLLTGRAQLFKGRIALSNGQIAIHQGPVVQRAYNAIELINRYPADKCYQNVLRYTPDREFSSG